MSLGKVGIKFRKTWVKFRLSLDKLSNITEFYIVNSKQTKKMEVCL